MAAASARKLCFCCLEEKTRTFSVFSKNCQSFNFQYNLQTLVNCDFDVSEYLDKSFVCDLCLKTVSKFVSFKENVLKEISSASKANSKRVANTPPSLLKENSHKRVRKESVAEQLIRFVFGFFLQSSRKTF